MKYPLHVLLVTTTLLVLGWKVSGQSTSEMVDEYSEEGQKALTEGRYGEAQQAYERLRALEPGVAEVHANLGVAYFREQHFEDAVVCFKRALQLKPTLKAPRALLAISLSELGQYSEALPDMERSFRESTSLEMKRMCGLELMRVYDNLHREADAVVVGVTLNRAYPNDPEILYQTSKVYGNYAFVTIDRLSQVAPTSLWRRLATAEAGESAGDFDQALAAYRAVLDIDPHRPGIHYRIARTLEARSQQSASSSDTQQASEELQEELKIDPSNANAAYELGVLYNKAGELDQAENCFEQALKNHSDFEEAHLGLGVVLMQKGKPELAISHLQRAVELAPEDAVAYYRLAEGDKAVGNTADAKEMFHRFQMLYSKQDSKSNRQRPTGDVTKQTVDLASP